MREGVFQGKGATERASLLKPAHGGADTMGLGWGEGTLAIKTIGLVWEDRASGTRIARFRLTDPVKAKRGRSSAAFRIRGVKCQAVAVRSACLSAVGPASLRMKLLTPKWWQISSSTLPPIPVQTTIGTTHSVGEAFQ